MKRYLYFLNKYFVILLFLQIIFFFNSSANPNIQKDTSLPVKQNIYYIDPTIGNVAQLLEPTRPTIHLPNQVIRVYPIRKDYLDDQISSFPLTAVSHRLGEVFAIKPSTGDINIESWNRRMPYDHNLEIIRPWYYSTYLVDDDVTVEFTPGKKTGFYRFSFPAGKSKSILFDVYNKGDAAWHFASGNEVTAMETYHGDIKIYMYGVFNTRGTVGVVENNQIKNDTAIAGKMARAYLSFPPGVSTIEFKYAISFISADQAKRNYDEEISAKTFGAVEKNAKKVWGYLVSQIKVE